MIKQDTICALSSPAGSGAIALIRLSGENAPLIADQCIRFSKKGKKLSAQPANTIHFGSLFQEETLIDDIVVSLFRAPHSYTGENLVEISCHGSLFIQQKILEILILKGARLAKPGEFTQRAFLNGKMDLSQAEGVADLIASSSEASHRLAINQMRGGFSSEINDLREELLRFISLIELELDFSEEDVEFADRTQLSELINKIDKLLSRLIFSFQYGNAIKNGIPVAIIGRTNAGKSTLLNRLLREEKAIVSDIAGTTRDFLEDTIVLNGIQFRFIDTAGLRHTEDSIETEGIQRTLQKYNQSSIVIILVDPNDTKKHLDESLSFLHEIGDEKEIKKLILALNKTDLLDEKLINEKLEFLKSNWKNINHYITISAKEGEGINQLEELLIQEAGIGSISGQDVIVSNVRHYEALKLATDALNRAKEGMKNELSSDFLAQDIREILHYLGEITGEITTDEVLGNIFRNFCIGK